MLTGFRVQNFKAFQDTGPIDLAPLTLLSGVNSAGKSSLIQMLLLLKQTLESGPSQALNPSQGAFLEQSLGDNFNDFLFERPQLDEASLTYHLEFAYDRDNDDEAELYDALNALLADLELGPVACGKVESPKRHPLGFDGALSSSVVVEFGWGPYGFRGRPTVRVANLQIKLLVDEHPLVGLSFHPRRGNYEVGHIEEATGFKLANLAFSQLEVRGLSNFLPDFLTITMQQPLLGSVVPPSFAELFRGLFAAVRRDLSFGIYYLNSFRVPPRRLYSGGQTAGMLLAPNGENFAEVLWRFREELVCFADPNGNEIKRPLSDMVTQVLSDILGLKQRVTVKAVGEREDILEVKVKTVGSTGTEVTLPDVGLGYNQVLPIIVQGLLTPPGALVIFEQPEIHLHPEIHARLIDFFSGLARTGRRVLIETHSTYMVDNLCLAIVKDRSNWLLDASQVLFVHPPDEQAASAKIELVQINRYGKILNYPPNFLPDVAVIYEQIIKESFAKRREERAAK
jgi:predicted ATPase